MRKLLAAILLLTPAISAVEPLVNLPHALSFSEAIPLESEVKCMALTVYREARGDSVEGQIAVAQVVLNRLKHPDFPSTVCKIVYQPKQFSWTAMNLKPPTDLVSLERAYIIARISLSGVLQDMTGGALFFASTSHKYKFTVKIGAHKFYRK